MKIYLLWMSFNLKKTYSYFAPKLKFGVAAAFPALLPKLNCAIVKQKIQQIYINKTLI